MHNEQSEELNGIHMCFFSISIILPCYICDKLPSVEQTDSFVLIYLIYLLWIWNLAFLYGTSPSVFSCFDARNVFLFTICSLIYYPSLIYIYYFLYFLLILSKYLLYWFSMSLRWLVTRIVYCSIKNTFVYRWHLVFSAQKIVYRRV